MLVTSLFEYLIYWTIQQYLFRLLIWINLVRIVVFVFIFHQVLIPGKIVFLQYEKFETHTNNLLSCIALRISEKSTSLFWTSSLIGICVSSGRTWQCSLPSKEIEEMGGVCNRLVATPRMRGEKEAMVAITAIAQNIPPLCSAGKFRPRACSSNWKQLVMLLFSLWSSKSPLIYTI